MTRFLIACLSFMLLVACGETDSDDCAVVMRRHYAEAVAQLDSCNYPAALISALEAKETVSMTTDRTYAAKINILVDTIAARAITAGAGKELFEIQRSYYQAQQQLIEDSASSCGTVTLIAIGLLMATLYFGSLFHRLKLSNKEIEVENRMNQLASFEAEQHRMLSDEQQHNTALRSHIDTLFADRYKTISLLCDEYFEKAGSEHLRLSLYKRVEDEINRLRTPQSLHLIEEAVNRYRDGIIARLRAQLPQLKPADITFITLIYAGFSPRAVCLLAGLSLKNYYTKRSRLRDRIAASTAPDRDSFTAMLY